MEIPFIEKGCTFEFEGRTFESGGAVVTDSHVIAYLGQHGILNDWHGNAIGEYAITSSWRINSCLSDKMCQVWAWVSGRQYTGRSLGVGMLFRGRRTAAKGNK